MMTIILQVKFHLVFSEHRGEKVTGSTLVNNRITIIVIDH